MLPEPLTRPWGLRRMKPYPAASVMPAVDVVLDEVTQTGRWVDPEGSLSLVPEAARHKRSETAKETRTRTSLDGTSDQGSDQSGDTD